MADQKSTTLVEVPGRLLATATHDGQVEEFKEEDTVSYRYVSDGNLRFLDSRPANGFRMNIGVKEGVDTKDYVINDATTDALVIFRGPGRLSMVTGVMRVDQNSAEGVSGRFNGQVTLDGVSFDINCTEFKLDTSGGK